MEKKIEQIKKEILNLGWQPCDREYSILLERAIEMADAFPMSRVKKLINEINDYNLF